MNCLYNSLLDLQLKNDSAGTKSDDDDGELKAAYTQRNILEIALHTHTHTYIYNIISNHN